MCVLRETGSEEIRQKKLCVIVMMWTLGDWCKLFTDMYLGMSACCAWACSMLSMLFTQITRRQQMRKQSRRLESSQRCSSFRQNQVGGRYRSCGDQIHRVQGEGFACACSQSEVSVELLKRRSAGELVSCSPRGLPMAVQSPALM